MRSIDRITCLVDYCVLDKLIPSLVLDNSLNAHAAFCRLVGRSFSERSDGAPICGVLACVFDQG